MEGLLQGFEYSNKIICKILFGFRSKILQGSGVKCSCDRCTDSTELGTGFGNLLCTKCPNFVAPEKPGKLYTTWIY